MIYIYQSGRLLAATLSSKRFAKASCSDFDVAFKKKNENVEEIDTIK